MNMLVKVGRPSGYSQELGEAICDGVAEGKSLEALGKELGFSYSMLWRWLAKDETFRVSYAQARLAYADALADSVVPLADSAQGKDAAGVQAVKLRTDARKWAAAKANPNAYGDKLDVTSAGKALPTPVHQVDARVQSIVMQATMRMRLAEALDPEASSLLE